MKDAIRNSWERFLNPEILRTNLIVASLFILAYDLLKESVIERVKSFFTDGFDENGWIINDDYKTKVLSLNRSPLYASLSWLQGMNIINKEDIEKFEEIKNHRNRIAHEVSNFISQETKIDLLPQFPKLIDLLSKVENWWILNIEIPTNPDFDGQDIAEDEIQLGKIMLLRVLFDIALGSEEESKYYYNEYLKYKKKKDST